MWLRRLAIGVNAVGTATTGAGLMPAAVVYPSLARAAATAGGTALDASLCFGPLLVPGLVVLGAWALRAAWTGRPETGPLNGAAAAGWLTVGLAVSWLVGAAGQAG